MSHSAEVKQIKSKGQAGADPHSVPLHKIDVSDAELFETDTHWGLFADRRVTTGARRIMRARRSPPCATPSP